MINKIFTEYRISDIGQVIGGGTPSTSIDEYWNGNIPWISPKDLTNYNCVYISCGENFISEKGLNKSGTKLLPENTVLFSSRAPIGYVAIAANSICTNQGFKSIICDPDKVDYLYLYYYLKANLQYIKLFANGATFPELSGKAMKNIKINIFNDVKYQRKIADTLFKYDNLIENNNKRIKSLEQMAENLYKEWFVRFRFPGYETTTFKSGIPSNWTIKKLKDFGRIETGKTPSTAKPENYGNAYHFVKTPDMHGNIFVIKTEEMLSEIGNNSQIKKLLPINSIMVSCIGSAGIVAINTKPAHTNQQINSIILDKPYELEWLYFTCKELKGTIQSFGANGATMTNLNKGKFEKLKVYYPTPEIISKFHQIVEPMFSELKSLLTINENLIKQRDLLLPRLMSGKLEVE